MNEWMCSNFMYVLETMCFIYQETSVYDFFFLHSAHWFLKYDKTSSEHFFFSSFFFAFARILHEQKKELQNGRTSERRPFFSIFDFIHMFNSFINIGSSMHELINFNANSKTIHTLIKFSGWEEREKKQTTERERERNRQICCGLNSLNNHI